MKPTERYLKHATRGLWGRARRELRAELSGHLNERVAELRLGSLSFDEAERQALRELGAPEQVSVGMLGVHTLPAVGKTGAVGVMVATALLTAIPQGLAQVRGIYGQVANAGASGYLDLEQLKSEVQKAGGNVSGPANAPILTFPGVAWRSQALDTKSWPGASLTQDGRTYLQAAVLIEALKWTGADLKLMGWTNPVLQIGSSKLQINTDDWRVLNELYLTTLFKGLGFGDAYSPISSLEPNGNTGDIALSGPFVESHIYALITPQFNDWTSRDLSGKVLGGGNIIFKSNINQAQAGHIQFRFDNDAAGFNLVSSMDDFQKALAPYADSTKLQRWDAKHPAPALILELDGRFAPDAYTVVASQAIERQ